MTATLIVVTSESGRAATMVTKYRPPCLVVVASTNETVSAGRIGLRPLRLSAGLTSFCCVWGGGRVNDMFAWPKPSPRETLNQMGASSLIGASLAHSC